MECRTRFALMKPLVRLNSGNSFVIGLYLYVENFNLFKFSMKTEDYLSNFFFSSFGFGSGFFKTLTLEEEDEDLASLCSVKLAKASSCSSFTEYMYGVLFSLAVKNPVLVFSSIL
jgi:hypothetical protein